EPFFDRNLRAFGYDMYSEPVRHEAMQKALESGNATLSGKVKLVQETGHQEQAGFLMYLPVYDNDRSYTSLAERRDSIVGWVYAPFRMDDFMEGAQGEHAADLDVEIFDGESTSSESLMYDFDDSSQTQRYAKSIYLTAKPVQLFGHTWTILIHPSDLFKNRVDTSKPQLFVLFGSILSILLGWLSWLILRGRKIQAQSIKSLEELRLQKFALDQHAIVGVADVRGKILYANDQFCKISGYAREELLGQDHRILNSGTHPKEYFREMFHTIAAGKVWYGEICNKTKDGQLYWVATTIVPYMDEHGKPTQYISMRSDITERKLMEEQIRQQALYDTLTNLPNRRILNERLTQTMAISKRSACYGALIFLDLDNFKPLNDTYGHVVGDLLLIEAANRLKNCVREIDTVARFGGDEFVVILSELDVDKAAATLQAQLVAEKF
ncbi:MAG: CHASE domain-containing protein, partial [Gallionellaceae bacterium]